MTWIWVDMLSEEISFDLDMNQLDALGDLAQDLWGENQEGSSKHVVCLVNEENEPEVAVLVEVNDVVNVIDIREEVSDYLTSDFVASAEKLRRKMGNKFGEIEYSVIISTSLVNEGLENFEESKISEWNDLYEVSKVNRELALDKKDEGWAVYPDVDLKALETFNPETLESISKILLPAGSYAFISLLGEDCATLYLGFDPDIFCFGNLNLEEEHKGEKIKTILKGEPKNSSKKLFNYFKSNYGKVSLGLVAKTEDIRKWSNQLSKLPKDERLSEALDILSNATDNEKIIIKTRPLLQPFLNIFVKLRPLIRPFVRLLA